MEFEEKQSLKIWWLYLVTGIMIFPTVAILIFSKEGTNWQELKQAYFLPILAVFLPFIIIYLIQQNTLTLKIDDKGISYRYPPFNFRMKVFTWMDIEHAYIRNYDGFSEYGGYEVKSRLWFKFNDKAYILNEGNQGLQLELKNGKKLLFSTNKKDQMELFLINLKKRYNIEAIQ